MQDRQGKKRRRASGQSRGIDGRFAAAELASALTQATQPSDNEIEGIGRGRCVREGQIFPNGGHPRKGARQQQSCGTQGFGTSEGYCSKQECAALSLFPSP